MGRVAYRAAVVAFTIVRIRAPPPARDHLLPYRTLWAARWAKMLKSVWQRPWGRCAAHHDRWWRWWRGTAAKDLLPYEQLRGALAETTALLVGSAGRRAVVAIG